MATLSVRTIAAECLGKSGMLSMEDDIFSIRDNPPPRSLKSELEFILEFRCPPMPPSNLRITEVTESTISIAWTDNADNEDGFEISYRGERPGFTDDNDTKKLNNPDRESHTLTGLFGGFEYCIKVRAFNQGGNSAFSNEVCATIPVNEVTRFVDLERQEILQGFIPYFATFPSGGIEKGRLREISVPQIGLADLQLQFVKPGFSTNDCDNPNAIVSIAEGKASTPEQLMEIFGVSEPRFELGNPITFIACVRSFGSAPQRVRINLTVILD